MTNHYLSPAFSRRTAQEIELLKNITNTSGFSIFWIDIVQPLLRHINATHLLEIGAYRGENTRLLTRYCYGCNGMLTVIEPEVLPCLENVIRQSQRICLFATKSRDAFPLISTPVDAVLLEGDLNYHTVYNDLVDIENMANRHQRPIPLIFLRATGWPYARRDMYYDPQSLKYENIQAYSFSGMTIWSPGLEAGMINYPFANAKNEGGSRNGVLTAAEDFINCSKIPLGIFTLPIHNGMSVIYQKDTELEQFIRAHTGCSNLMIRLLETIEVARLNSITDQIKALQRQRLRAGAGKIGRLEQLLYSIIRFIFNKIRYLV